MAIFLGTLICILPKGEYKLQERNAWRRAALRTRKSEGKWVIWATNSSRQTVLEQLTLSKSGKLDTTTITDEDRHYGLGVRYYNADVMLVASDSSAV